MQKNKGNTAVPDARIAKVFNFTSEDLSANRLGFITSAQQFNAPQCQRKLFGFLGQYIKFGQAKQRVKVGQRCGRIELIEETSEIFYSVRRQVIDMVKVYGLKVKDKHFKLNQAQFRTLRQSAFYKVYYDSDNDRIVAIERVENDC